MGCPHNDAKSMVKYFNFPHKFSVLIRRSYPNSILFFCALLRPGHGLSLAQPHMQSYTWSHIHSHNIPSVTQKVTRTTAHAVTHAVTHTVTTFNQSHKKS